MLLIYYFFRSCLSVEKTWSATSISSNRHQSDAAEKLDLSAPTEKQWNWYQMSLSSNWIIACQHMEMKVFVAKDVESNAERRRGRTKNMSEKDNPAFSSPFTRWLETFCALSNGLSPTFLFCCGHAHDHQCCAARMLSCETVCILTSNFASLT